jgi:putative FmdB family regulatory protein
MPIYEYTCRTCAREFEQILFSNQEAVACPQCESKQVERKLSVFSSPGSRSSGEPPAGGCGCTPQTCGCH